MGFIEDKQKAAAYDAAVAQQAAALKAQGANEVLNAQAQDRAMREALAMQEMLKQPGMASALVGPQYAANTAAAEELKRQYIMQQGDDAVRAQYGASVAPTGNVSQGSVDVGGTTFVPRGLAVDSAQLPQMKQFMAK